MRPRVSRTSSDERRLIIDEAFALLENAGLRFGACDALERLADAGARIDRKAGVARLSCERAGSLGDPVLKDPRFRVALDYAIDCEKLVAIAYGGEAVPGTTVLPPDNWVDPDYHWQPPEGVLRTFDLEKAKSLLDEAGYKDTNGDGVRESKGKPIKLRLWALNTSVQNQSAGKLSTGWFGDLGLDIQLEVVN